MTMALPNLVRKARKQLAELTGLGMGSTVSVRRDERQWRVRVEVIEKKSLPDSQDILATYELTLDEQGQVTDLARVGLRRRMDVAVSVGTDQEL